jgi:hypothetical protein
VWLKMALFATGGTVTVISIVDLIDVHAKAEALEDRFGIPTGVVTATAGIGLWLVLAAGLVMLVAGLVAKRAETPVPLPSPPPAPPLSAPEHAYRAPARAEASVPVSRPGSPD